MAWSILSSEWQQCLHRWIGGYAERGVANRMNELEAFTCSIFPSAGRLNTHKVENLPLVVRDEEYMHKFFQLVTPPTHPPTRSVPLASTTFFTFHTLLKGSSTSFSFTNVASDDNTPYILWVVVTVGSTRTTVRRKIWIPGKKPIKHPSTVDLIVNSFIAWNKKIPAVLGRYNLAWDLVISVTRASRLILGDHCMHVQQLMSRITIMNI